MASRGIDGERERLRSTVRTLRAALDAMDVAIDSSEKHEIAIGCEAVQTVTQEAGRLNWHTAAHDALWHDGRRKR